MPERFGCLLETRGQITGLYLDESVMEHLLTDWCQHESGDESTGKRINCMVDKLAGGSTGGQINCMVD